MTRFATLSCALVVLIPVWSTTPPPSRPIAPASASILSSSRPVGACTSLPATTCRRASTQSRKGPPSVSRQASIASPARSDTGKQVPHARPSSRRRHRRPERGLHRDRRSGRARRPARHGHPGRRLPALRQRKLPDLGATPHRPPQRAGGRDRVQGQLQQWPHGAGRQRPRGPCVHPSQRSVRDQRHHALRRLPWADRRDHRGQRDRVQQHAAAPDRSTTPAGPSSRPARTG